ncbi:MAG TPA: HEAT repeat domain-containing protein [Herpetosiphonaceae bacterium]|nr:HEAT repeat domain-containing protein [Herpetosiphonaceae bacterium]
MTHWRYFAAIMILIILAGCSTTTGRTPIPNPTTRPLADLLTDIRAPDPITQAIAVSDLSHYGPAAAHAVPDLIAMIDDPLNPYGVHDLDAESRVSVMETLGSIGPAAAAAAPTLAMIAQEPKEHTMVRSAAIRALGKLHDHSVVPVLVPLLYGSDPTFTRTVGRTIETLAQRDFPEDDGVSWLTENGQSVIAVAVGTWWDSEGQYQEWK